MPIQRESVNGVPRAEALHRAAVHYAPMVGNVAPFPRRSLFDRWLHCASDKGCADCGAEEVEIQFCRDRWCPFKVSA